MRKSIFVFGLFAATFSVSASTLKDANITKVVAQQPTKKVEIEAAKLPEKITKSIMDANKERKIVKAYQIVDAAAILSGYEVVVVTDKKEEVFKFDKNGDMLKEVVTPNPNAPKPNPIAPAPVEKK